MNLSNHQYSNQWHWTDKDISPHFKKSITENLEKINSKIDNCKTVEAVLHRRKGKLYLIYEVVLDGTSANGNTFSINEWDHDTPLEDTLSCQNKDDRAKILSSLKDLDEELKKVHGKDLGVELENSSESAKPVSLQGDGGSKSTASTDSPLMSIAVKDKFYCGDQQFVDLFVKPELMRMWSRNALEVVCESPLEGKFGHVHFKNVKHTVHKDNAVITMDWKLSNWKTFTHCKVTKNGAEVQATLNCQDKEMVSQIWRERYFFAMKSIFGYS
eukprot:NODE_592_length_5620_cov_0.720884.p3 type:complete len:271 gc:universal NODE_592_length_5620_cov_0.720884:3886-4698(+)